MERTSFWSWMNEETGTVLQRDNTFAMLTWRDFNQPQELGLSFPVIASLFMIGAVLPLVVFH